MFDVQKSPKLVGIELVRGCNFKCKMCPVTANHKGPLQFMELDLLRNVAEKLESVDTIDTIWLFHFGEPLAHPKFRECLDLLSRFELFRNKDIVMHTNASLLKGDKADAILDIPIINKLVFSFDGFGDKESYEALRGENYDKVLENIREFSMLAKEKRPDLVLETCTILPKNSELPEIISIKTESEAREHLERIFNPLGVNVCLREMHDYNGSKDLALSGEKKKILGGCAFIEKYALYILADGAVAPCCAVYDSGFNVGSIKDLSIDELLNNPEIERVRHNTRIDNRKGLKFCQNCSLSLGNNDDEAYLKNYWKAKIQNNEVKDQDELVYIETNIIKEYNVVLVNKSDEKLELLLDQLPKNTRHKFLIKTYNQINENFKENIMNVKNLFLAGELNMLTPVYVQVCNLLGIPYYYFTDDKIFKLDNFFQEEQNVEIMTKAKKCFLSSKALIDFLTEMSNS